MAKEKEIKLKIKTPTAQKRLLQNEKQRLINQTFKSKVKTAIRCFKDTLKNDDIKQSQDTLNIVYSLMDKGAKTNIYKKNKSSRVKSRLSMLFQKKTPKEKSLSN